jgi:hypothetical protein
MILADTSVWVAHLRAGDARLARLLMKGSVACHPFIIGELACGSLGNRAELLRLLAALPACRVADHDEVMQMIERRNLHSKGLGYVDVHLLASALLTDVHLWTADLHLRTAARTLRASYD